MKNDLRREITASKNYLNFIWEEWLKRHSSDEQSYEYSVLVYLCRKSPIYNKKLPAQKFMGGHMAAHKRLLLPFRCSIRN